MSKSTIARPEGHRSAPTRERIVTEALRLIAERGYRGTTIADIEAAAGLSPGSGALYKHFASKQAVLAAGLERHAEVAEAVASALKMMPLDDFRSELMLFARGALQELQAEENLIKILLKEADQFPRLLAKMRQRLVDLGYRQTAEWLRLKVEAGTLPPHDCEAVAAIALGSIVNYQMVQFHFGRPPGEVDEDRFVAAWVDMVEGLVERRRHAAR
ncbi:MAG: TetR/AcrR family transcriptional regulator [Actinomycetota bacterium]